MVDAQGVCLAANEAFAQPLGGVEKVTGHRFLDLVPEDTPANVALHKGFPALLQAREGDFECRLPTPGGEVLWLEVRVRPLEWEGKAAVALTCQDVTLLRRTQEQLQRVRETDYTTGILNRQGMERILERETQRATIGHTALSLILLDIDGFRRVNETGGYAAADHALKVLTSGLKNALSAGDVMGRWGGDAFMVLTPKSVAAARLMADTLRDLARSGPFGREFRLTFSVGVAEFGGEMPPSALVGAAYDAMVSAKRAGGDRTVVAERQRIERQTTEMATGIEVGTEEERMEHVGTDSDHR